MELRQETQLAATGHCWYSFYTTTSKAGPGYQLLALDNHDVTNESYRGGQNTIKHEAEQYGTPWNNAACQKISPSERYQTGKSNNHRALHHVPSLCHRTGRPSTHYRCLLSCPLQTSPTHNIGPCYRTKPRSTKDASRKAAPPHPKRNRRSAQIHSGTP